MPDYYLITKLSYWSSQEAAGFLIGYSPNEYDAVISTEVLYKSKRASDYSLMRTLNAIDDRNELEREMYDELKLSNGRRKWLKGALLKSRQVMELLKRDIEAGIITGEYIFEDDFYFIPANIINWAISKGFLIPDELRAFADAAKLTEQPEDLQSKQDEKLNFYEFPQEPECLPDGNLNCFYGAPPAYGNTGSGYRNWNSYKSITIGEAAALSYGIDPYHAIDYIYGNACGTFHRGAFCSRIEELIRAVMSGDIRKLSSAGSVEVRDDLSINTLVCADDVKKHLGHTNNQHNEPEPVEAQPEDLQSKQDGNDCGAVADARSPKIPVKEQRDSDFTLWMENYRPEISSMKKKDINQLLVDRNIMMIGTATNLWISNFNGWWKSQTIFKGVQGRKKN